MRILALTSHYPSVGRPCDGLAVENRLRALARTGAIDLRVVAPRPWRTPEMPGQELRRGLLIHQPPLPPGAAKWPRLLAASVAAKLRMLRQEFPFDLISAHGLYPDGAAAALLARRFAVPFTVTVRGADLAAPWGWPFARPMMRWTVARAAGLVAATPSAEAALMRLGAQPERLRLLPDGVDLTLFRPGDRTAARLRLGFRGRTLLAVGPFPRSRDDAPLVEALALLPGIEQLVMVGGGPGAAALADHAHARGVARRIRMLDSLAHEALPEFYRAADALVVCRTGGGDPAPVLEAIACGTPVVATAGAAGLLTTPDAGRLVERANDETLAAAIAALFATPPDRAATRAVAERFDWGDSAVRQVALFAGILGERHTSLAA